MPGRPMSSSTTSGWAESIRARASGPECATATSCPARRRSRPRLCAESARSSTTSTRFDPGGAGARRGTGGGGPRGAAVAAGSRTLNSLPSPSPSLWTAMLPPWCDTRVHAIVRPIPSPPCERSSERSACMNRSKTRAWCSRLMPDARCRGPGPRPLPPRHRPRARCGPLVGVFHRVMQQVPEHLLQPRGVRPRRTGARGDRRRSVRGASRPRTAGRSRPRRRRGPRGPPARPATRSCGA